MTWLVFIAGESLQAEWLITLLISCWALKYPILQEASGNQKCIKTYFIFKNAYEYPLADHIFLPSLFKLAMLR